MLTFVVLASTGGAVAVLVWLLLFRYVALGDSLAVGVGSLLFWGYVPRFAFFLMRRLRRLVIITNLGRFGMTSGELLEAIRSDERFRSAVRKAHLITLDIGGNDLRRCGQSEACLAEAVTRFAANWPAILQEVRSLNERAVLLTMTLYNPIPPDDPLYPTAARFISALNAVITDSATAERYQLQGIAPVHDLFAGHACAYTWYCLIRDIHPNDRGYGAMAAALERAFSGEGAARSAKGRGNRLRRESLR